LVSVSAYAGVSDERVAIRAAKNVGSSDRYEGVVDTIV
jgi:hypothetical protein